MNFCAFLLIITIALRGVVAPGIDPQTYIGIKQVFVDVSGIEKPISLQDFNRIVSFKDNNPLFRIKTDYFAEMVGQPYNETMKVYYKTGHSDGETKIELKASPKQHVYMPFMSDFPIGESFKLYDKKGREISAVGMTEFTNKALKHAQVDASEIVEIGESVSFYKSIGGLFPVPVCSHAATPPKYYRFDFP